MANSFLGSPSQGGSLTSTGRNAFKPFRTSPGNIPPNFSAQVVFTASGADSDPETAVGNAWTNAENAARSQAELSYPRATVDSQSWAIVIDQMLVVDGGLFRCVVCWVFSLNDVSGNANLGPIA